MATELPSASRSNSGVAARVSRHTSPANSAAPIRTSHGQARGDGLRRGIAAGERQDHTAEQSGEQNRSEEVGRGQHRGELAQRDERVLGQQQPQDQQHQRPDQHQRQGLGPATTVGPWHVDVAVANRVDQGGRPHHQQQGRPGDDGEQEPADQVARAMSPPVLARRSLADQRRERQPRDQVDPEDRTPSAERDQRCPVQRSEQCAQLLYGTHDAERKAAPVGGVQVSDQRQRDGNESAAAEALEEAAEHDDGQVMSAGGHGRPEGEAQHAGEQHRAPAVQVGQSAHQRQQRDVAEQEPGDDRRCLLQLVGRQADAVHDVGQHQHDHVGVGRGEEYGEAGQDEAPALPTGSAGGTDADGLAVVAQADGQGALL